MKQFLSLITIIIAITFIIPMNSEAQENTGLPVAVKAADPADKNNNFYDNIELYSIPCKGITVEGEVENPGMVDFSKLQLRTVIAKEAALNPDGSNHFIGAYRYDGYSLFDILQNYVLNKKNKETYRPIIDLYVIIENDKGEKVILSWGEIYYPSQLHQILVATQVARIVPSKTKDLWPLPKESKLVVVNDLLNERNISNPVKITIKSWERDFPVNREVSPLTSPDLSMEINGKTTQTINSVPEIYPKETYQTIFYGRGRGIHSTTPFNGILVRDLLEKQVKFNSSSLKNGIIAMVGADGYRAVYSFSEFMNRGDQSQILLVPCDPKADGGSFRIFPSCDFFSDRAVKALSKIIVETE